jgi:hypothetical protein
VLGSLGCRVGRVAFAVTFNRWPVNAETAGGLSALGIPFFTDSTIFFSLRSDEYGFMFPRYPAHPHRNPL